MQWLFVGRSGVKSAVSKGSFMRSSGGIPVWKVNFGGSVTAVLKGKV